MLSESEIQNCKRIFLDEVSFYGNDYKAEKVFDETFERLRNLDFSKFQDKEKAIDKLFETLETPPEFVAFFKDSLVNNKFDTTLEECIKNGVHIGKKFIVDSLANNKFDIFT